MKKLITNSTIALLLLTSIPQLQAATETSPPSTTSTTSAAPNDATVLLARLDEINTMDKSNLSSSEKKVLRQEVHSIKNNLNSSSGGIYLSVGALIIIIVLLIILL